MSNHAKPGRRRGLAVVGELDQGSILRSTAELVSCPAGCPDEIPTEGRERTRHIESCHPQYAAEQRRLQSAEWDE
jgi:hypothetical protein